MPASEWARLARSRCSACGSVLLQWLVAVDLPFHVSTLSERKRVAEILRWVGGDADAWVCGHCGEWGVFGPVEQLV